MAFYGAGYLFARSGWGEHRAYADEVDLALHYGPRRIIHGHDDQGSLTLYGYGARLLLDPGKFSYNRDRWPVFFRSRAAHNVVTADGLTWSTSKGMSLVSHAVTSRAVDARLVGTGYSGVTWRRRVTYSRRLDWIVVDDRINTTTTRTFRQLWHLAPRSAPTVSGSSVRTHTTRGNVVIRQLTGTATTRILTGRTSPIQGWQSDSDLHRVPAPAVEFAKRGRSVRYLTLIVPGCRQPTGDGVWRRAARGRVSHDHHDRRPERTGQRQRDVGLRRDALSSALARTRQGPVLTNGPAVSAIRH